MKLNLVIFSLLLFSCHNNKQDKPNKNNAAIESKSPDMSHFKIGISDFKEYWKEFSIAIQTGDTNKLKLLVADSLQIEGREDEDPHFIIHSHKIVKYVAFAIKEGGYYDLDKNTSIGYKTMFQSDLKHIREYKEGENSQWIEDFAFEKTTRGWKLVSVYMDTKDLENKLK